MTDSVIKKSHYRLYTAAVTKKKHVAAKCRTWSAVGQLLMASVKSKLVYSCLILVDNKLTLICPLTYQQSVTVSVRRMQVLLLIRRILHLWGQKSKANSISRFACNFAKCSPIFKNSFTSKLNDKFGNEATHNNVNAWLYYFVIYH